MYQTIDSRVGTFQKLLKLSGRLDLVSLQIRMRSNQSSGESNDINQEMLVYNEGILVV